MLIKEISYHKNFKCLEGACPHTCCHGWIIPVDEDEFERYMQEKGLLKLRLVLAMLFRNGTGFNVRCGSCTFHTKEGLCELQLKKGHEFLPGACQEYPRFYRNYGFFEERYLDLSCIQAVRMFFDHMDDLTLTEYEGKEGSGTCTTNDDGDYLKALGKCRDEMLSLLKKCHGAKELNEALIYITDHAKRAQGAFVLGDTDFLTRESVAPNVSDAVSLNKEIDPMERNIGDHLSDKATGRKRLFPLSAEVLRDILDTGLYSPRLRMTNPTLHELFTLPLKKYRSLMRSEDSWETAWDDFVKKYPKAVKICSAYYSYYLLQYYFSSFEDYSFLRHVNMGIIQMNMVFLLMCLKERSKGSFSDEDAMEIMACYNRRAYFNEDVKDEMYDTFMSHFFIS